MSRNTSNRSKKQKGITLTISEWLNKVQEYSLMPGKILPSGEMLILFHGHWIKKGEVLKLLPPPTMPDFVRDRNNTDKTKLWML